MNLDLQLTQAIQSLIDHKLVVIPTETVYGLAARADSSEAIQKIYEAKGRPSNNPLIVHFHSITQIEQWLSLPAFAKKLGEKFWPGPLTLIIKSSDKICGDARAGLDTVAIRIPNHPVALHVLKEVNIPLAAPSANRSGHISPTCAEHVKASLGKKVEIILEGGPCEVGLESTVLDLTSKVPRILRPGRISQEEIEKEIGPVELFDPKLKQEEKLLSPGLLEKHYAPNAKVIILSKEEILKDTNQNHGLLTHSFEKQNHPYHILLSSNPSQFGQLLYASLYQLEKTCSKIVIEEVPTTSAWKAINNRLSRMLS